MNTVCAKRLANMGHAVLGAVWLSVLSSELCSGFIQDISGLPNYRFPKTVVVFILLFFVSEGFGIVPPLCIFFPPFLIKFDIGGIGWRFPGVPT